MIERPLGVVVRGGLGNQMFQVAHAMALCARFGLQPWFLDFTAAAAVSRKWELDCFRMTQKPLSRLAQSALVMKLMAAQKLQRLGLGGWPGVLIESTPSSVSAAPTIPPRLVSGYWQSACYFSPIEEEVRKLFRFPSLPKGCEAVTKKDSSLPTVAIHVRRGDYISNLDTRNVHLVCDAAWYRAAWQRMCELVGPCRGVLFSDDPVGARQALRPIQGVDFASSDPSHAVWVDMARMSACDHFIISNSTYSWWAAYLSQSSKKRVIAPRQWFCGQDTADLRICPPSWVLI